LVQGDGAIEDIVNAITMLDSENLDCIIVGRGGGSIEDLWAFNTESVARSIFMARTPVISAVGHETDFTIADFVADMRAATPTAAAELVTPITLQNRLPELAFTAINEQKRTIEQLLLRSGFRRVNEQLKVMEQSLDSHEIRMSLAIKRSIAAMKMSIDSKGNHCKSLYPLSPLKKGFALLEKGTKTLTAEDELSIGEELTLIRQYTKHTILIQSQ
jgi:exodeoxyribonuclease VII large subunit